MYREQENSHPEWADRTLVLQFSSLDIHYVLTLKTKKHGTAMSGPSAVSHIHVVLSVTRLRTCHLHGLFPNFRWRGAGH